MNVIRRNKRAKPRSVDVTVAACELMVGSANQTREGICQPSQEPKTTSCQSVHKDRQAHMNCVSLCRLPKADQECVRGYADSCVTGWMVIVELKPDECDR